MSDKELRSKENTALWLGIAITLLPLVPYALFGGGGG